jgi:hypothetical protein
MPRKISVDVIIAFCRYIVHTEVSNLEVRRLGKHKASFFFPAITIDIT